MGYVSILIHCRGILLKNNDMFKYKCEEVYLWQDVDVDKISYLDIEDELNN